MAYVSHVELELANWSEDLPLFEMLGPRELLCSSLEERATMGVRRGPGLILEGSDGQGWRHGMRMCVHVQGHVVKVAHRCARLGGTVEVERIALGDGAFSVLRDPWDRALFVWSGMQGPVECRDDHAGVLLRQAIWTGEQVHRAAWFYEELFGWNFRPLVGGMEARVGDFVVGFYPGSRERCTLQLQSDHLTERVQRERGSLRLRCLAGEVANTNRETVHPFSLAI